MSRTDARALVDSMSEREKDYVARMLLRVVQEIHRRVKAGEIRRYGDAA